jgi:hypothetical protein
MREVAGLPPKTVEYMRSQPVWQARVDAAHTIPRELRAVKAYWFDPERFRELGVPTLVVSGGDSAAKTWCGRPRTGVGSSARLLQMASWRRVRIEPPWG